MLDKITSTPSPARDAGAVNDAGATLGGPGNAERPHDRAPIVAPQRYHQRREPITASGDGHPVGEDLIREDPSTGPLNPAARQVRCAAAHVSDPRPCQGRPDTVRIVDQTGADTEACLLHGAVLLASLHLGRVYPLHGPQGSAITVYQRARDLPPFDFLAKLVGDEDPVAARYGAGNAWPAPGNPRSSRWDERDEDRPRGIA